MSKNGFSKSKYCRGVQCPSGRYLQQVEDELKNLPPQIESAEIKEFKERFVIWQNFIPICTIIL